MSKAPQNLYALAAVTWLRVVVFSNAPSLLVVALVTNLVALIPAAFGIKKENLSERPLAGHIDSVSRGESLKYRRDFQ